MINTVTHPIFRNSAYVVLLAFTLLITACETEEENARYPFKEITAFSVEVENESLSAAITEGQITLYWPHTLEVPATITPAIALSEKAVIEPASGVSIALQDGVVYTVTAEDGSTATYTLDLVINQPLLSLREEDNIVAAYEGLLDLQGSNFLLNEERNRVYLISKDGEETGMDIYALGDNFATGFASNIQLSIPAENAAVLDTCWYKVKVVSGAQTITSNRAYVYIRYPYPRFDIITNAITVARGGTFTIYGRNFRDMRDARVAEDQLNIVYHDLTLESYTLTSVTYRVPDDFPTGSFYSIWPGIVSYPSRQSDYDSQLHSSYETVHPMLIVTE